MPLDGVVIAGRSAVDQAPVTGESVPVDKEPGDTVFAGTVNQKGSLDVRVTKLVSESTLAQIARAVAQAQTTLPSDSSPAQPDRASAPTLASTTRAVGARE